ncbi:hypothetical protein DB42_BV00260 [Neochlamydia sp. EPS4]|nr:hypothetical protein DB42_BV00260 [Neochlamydia sp. EPS4]
MLLVAVAGIYKKQNRQANLKGSIKSKGKSINVFPFYDPLNRTLKFS